MKQDIYRKLSDGIIYLFQYGYITEAKHFKMLDALNERSDDGYHDGRKF